MKKWLSAFFLFPAFSLAQMPAPDSTSVRHARSWLVGAGTVAAYGGSLAILSTAWYKNYPRSSFHTFNDAGEWQQMDKAGHAWTAYTYSRINSDLWRWAGVSRGSAVALGAGSSLLYMLSIEYLDGHSAEWGWSWPDAGADIFGAALYAGQELGWKEQKVRLKFSTHRKNYSEPDLQKRADELFGKSLSERLLKDYNAQTYWLSTGLHSVFPRLPAWLNLAVGYGAGGMFGGYENLARDKNGTVTFDRRDIRRYRQWYLAPDVDLSAIKTKSHFLHGLFSVFNSLKFPAPALEFSKNRFHLRAFVF